jgi:diaminohydroxyphosphoribosylaminopyrimidine deaminase/5-amino-6-(5-phosphoribosylamino)uracil reductase
VNRPARPGVSLDPVEAADLEAMRRALELAERGWGRVAPNPLVGAVVVREGLVVGEGFHEEFGREHAEVVALRQAGDKADGATLFVNLEPCSHRGKTPACTTAIVDAGIRRVAVGARDPHPDAGGGVDELRRAGVEVTLGVLRKEASLLNAPFLWRHTTGMPFVGLKLALSLDGRLSGSVGKRERVSGDEADAWVYRLRAGYDCLLVGSGTAMVDDPLLTVRGDVRPRRPPLRVVVDSDLELPLGSRLVTTSQEAPVLVFAAPEAVRKRGRALRDRGVAVAQAMRHRGGLELTEILRGLADREVGSILVEGGGRMGSALLREGLVQRMYLVFAPVFLGEQGVPAFVDLPGGVGGGWAVWDRRQLGEDTLLQLEAEEVAERLEAI